MAVNNLNVVKVKFMIVFMWVDGAEKDDGRLSHKVAAVRNGTLVVL